MHAHVIVCESAHMRGPCSRAHKCLYTLFDILNCVDAELLWCIGVHVSEVWGFDAKDSPEADAQGDGLRASNDGTARLRLPERVLRRMGLLGLTGLAPSTEAYCVVRLRWLLDPRDAIPLGHAVVEHTDLGSVRVHLKYAERAHVRRFGSILFFLPATIAGPGL